jgi:hypothetical protein
MPADKDFRKRMFKTSGAFPDIFTFVVKIRCRGLLVPVA